MAVVGCVIFAIACFCPMALFRLLAFVDPGTASGASFRTPWPPTAASPGWSRAARARTRAPGPRPRSRPTGGPPARRGADAETANRFQSRAAKAFGVAGKAVGEDDGRVGGVAATGASMSVDVMGQAGVGHQGYYDTTPPRRTGKPPPQRTRVGTRPRPGGVANDPAHIGNADDAAARGRGRGDARMTVYGASATRDRQGWFFGLTGPQLFLVLAAAFPCWLAMSVGQWAALLGAGPAVAASRSP